MLAPVKRLVLRFARVPAEPHAPAGSPGSIQVFRAAENYWKYLLVRWGIKQAAGAFAIVFFASMSHVWIEGLAASPLVRKEKAAALEPAPAPAPESRAKRARRGKRLVAPRLRAPHPSATLPRTRRAMAGRIGSTAATRPPGAAVPEPCR